MNEYQVIGCVLIFGSFAVMILGRLIEIRNEIKDLRVLELTKMDLDGYNLTEQEHKMVDLRLSTVYTEYED